MEFTLDSIGDEIGLRVLDCRDGAGNSSPVRVVLGRPEVLPGSTSFYCPFQILGLGNSSPKYAVGVDSIQAITLAFRMIAVELEVRQSETNARLSWLGSEPTQLGF